MNPIEAKMDNSGDFKFEYGAEWVRVDFHLHTKADKEFKYSDAADYYYSNYVDALEKAGIRVAVITNHNKFDFEEFKALRRTARKKNILLLPGVELSVGDGNKGVHTLIVFSDSWIENGNDYINPFITASFHGKAPIEYENTNGRSSYNLNDTLRMLDNCKREFFLIFAHVEDSSGLWKELSGGRLKELASETLFQRLSLGFQKVRSENGAGRDVPCREKAKEHFGKYYLAEVEGSDPKNIDEIGKGKPCYLKLSELSFEAVRFALQDFEARVDNDPDKRTTSFIRSIRFDGGILNGKMIRFSPELNTLIGIRGSGKSSILEAIRYVLDIPREANAADKDYKDSLIKHTLGSGGKITLMAHDIYGQDFTVSRIFREAPNVYIDGKLQPGISIRETVVRKPIFFGQKELASTGANFESDLVEKLVGDKLRSRRNEIEAQRVQVREAVKRFEQLRNVADQKAEYEAQLQDAKFRISQFTKLGIEEKLAKRLAFDQDAGALRRIREHVQRFADDLTRLIADHEDELRNSKAYTSKENTDFFAAVFRQFDQFLSVIDRLKGIEQETRQSLSRLQQSQATFDNARRDLQEEFAEIERKLAEELRQTNAAPIQPDDFLQQQQRRTKAEQMLEVLEKQDARREAITTDLLQELDKLNELWLAEFNDIKQELDKVNENQEALKIEAEFKADKDAAVAFLQQLCRGSGIRETTLRSILEDYPDFGGLFKDFDKAKLKAGSSPDVFEKIFFDNLSDLLTWQVPSQFVIRYRGKELKHHSLGQRASALILYVLSQRQNDVIIIDQPEDDLDNQTIYDDVIKLILELKPSTQFIFATHNPNFPVLGDAEQVHACRYQDEEISINSGGIDSRPIQEEIISIMEGGAEAFQKRKEVYQLWKSPNSSK